MPGSSGSPLRSQGLSTLVSITHLPQLHVGRTVGWNLQLPFTQYGIEPMTLHQTQFLNKKTCSCKK